MRRRKAAPQWATWPLEAIKPYPANARTHPPEQVALLARMLKRWGPDQPIVVDEAGTILKGHGRLLAAKEAGLAEFPVVQRSGLSKTDKQAIRLADNQIALLSGWDASLIAAELGELKVADFDLSLLGFAEIDFRKWGLTLGTEGLTDPEEAPPLPEEPIVRMGDLWELGEHQLLCGDATAPADVNRLPKAPLMVTDPPYGVEYNADWRNHAFRADGTAIGGRAIGKVHNDYRDDWTDAWILFGGDVAYCWHAGLRASNTQQAFERCGFELRAQCIWAKQHFVIGRGHYHVKHEPCFYLVRKGSRGHWAAGRDQTTLWEIDKPRKSETGHSTQKPIECMKRPIENNSKKSDYVYDPFVGSGTTIIAAEMTGRKCLAIEIDPSYVEVCINRWQNFTGKLATLKGKTLEEVRKERATPPARSGKRRKLKEFHPVSLDT